MYDLIGLQKTREELICDECKKVIRTLEQPKWIRRGKVRMCIQEQVQKWRNTMLARYPILKVQSNRAWIGM